MVWPGKKHRLELTLSLPQGGRSTSLSLTSPGLDRTIRLRAGEHRRVALCVPTGNRPWIVRLTAARPSVLPDGRFVSVQSTMPKLAAGSC